MEFDMKKKFRGTYTVLITPFTADGKKVDEPPSSAWSISRSRKASTA